MSNLNNVEWVFLIVWFCSTWGLAGELVGWSCLAPAELHVIVGWQQGSVPDDARVNKREKATRQVGPIGHGTQEERLWHPIMSGSSHQESSLLVSVLNFWLL